MLHVSNWIYVWCYISLVCSELGWVDGGGCVWVCGDWVTFFSNIPIRFFLSSGAMVLRLDPSIIAFSSIFLNSPCSANTFSQYRIWDPKDYIRDIDWVLSCLFTSSPSCVLGFFYAVYATSVSFCSPACYSWTSRDIVSGASVGVAIADCVGLKTFSTSTPDTAISWDLDELYFTILFSIIGGTGAYLVKYTLMLFCPWFADGVWMASISAGVLPSIVLCTLFFLSCFCAQEYWMGRPRMLWLTLRFLGTRRIF